MPEIITLDVLRLVSVGINTETNRMGIRLRVRGSDATHELVFLPKDFDTLSKGIVELLAQVREHEARRRH